MRFSWPHHAVSDCAAGTDSKRLGRALAHQLSGGPSERPSGRSARRRESAVRPRRARRSSGRSDLRRVPAAGRSNLLRGERQRHVPALSRPDPGDLEPRLVRQAVRQGVRAGRRGRRARCRRLLCLRGPVGNGLEPGDGSHRAVRWCCGAQRVERPGRLALPSTRDVPHLLRHRRHRLVAHRAGDGEGLPAHGRLERDRRQHHRRLGSREGTRASGTDRARHGARTIARARIRGAHPHRHRRPASPCDRRLRRLRRLEDQPGCCPPRHWSLPGRRASRDGVAQSMTDADVGAAGRGRQPLACPQCGTQIAPALLACPSCHRLVHSDALKRLAAEAERSAQAGDMSAALAAWRQARELLPPDATQHTAVSARILELSRALDSRPAATKHGSPWGKGAAGVGAVSALLAKFKFVLLFVLTKAKFLLLGLTKGGTFLSMLLSAGLYWTIWGWKFAFGLVLSIYIHEMGHVQALQRYGIKATAPMFIPGFGAVIRLKQYPADAREDARVGLAGPLWGLGAALAAYAVYRATGVGVWGAIAHMGALVNLFNLVPVWQLDGARGFRALTRPQRWIAVAVIAVLWSVTSAGLLVLLGLAAAATAAFSRAAEEPDHTALLQYAFLVAVLSLMTRIAVPATGP